jgi:hypothetical protein
VPVAKQFEVKPTDRPTKPRKNTPRPLCHATDGATYLGYRKTHREFCYAYHEASAEYRSGNREVIFPDYSYPPSLVYLLTG